MTDRPTSELENRVDELETMLAEAQEENRRLKSILDAVSMAPLDDLRDRVLKKDCPEELHALKSALELSERRFQALFNTMNEGVCLHELIYDDDNRPVDYRILDVNPMYEAITGISRETAVGKQASVLYGTGAPPFFETYAHVAQTGQAACFDIFWEPMEKHFLVSVVSSVKGRFATVFTDITLQKEKEEELRLKEEHLATTLNSIGDAVISTDTRGRIVRMNPVAESLTGWRIDEARGVPLDQVFRIVNEQTRKPVTSPVKKVLDQGIVVGLANHTVLMAKDGRQYCIDDSASPIRDGRGSIIGVVLIFRDITEKYRVEQDRAFQATLLNQIQDHVVATDLKGTIVYVNDTEVKATGYSRETLIGKAMDVLGEDPTRGATQKQIIQSTLDKGTWQGEVVNYAADGSEIIMDCRTTLIRDREGNPWRIAGVSTDITERRRMAELIRQAQKLESIGSLAGGIAHDFNNILFPIVGISEMLLEDLEPGSPEHENIREILKAGIRGSGLVKQILTFSRQSENKKMPIRIQEVLREVLSLSRSTIPSSIGIQADIQENLGFVLADPTQIHQIAMNLITNAMHAIEDRGGTIRVGLQGPDMDGVSPGLSNGTRCGRALFTVVDDGCGISPSIIDKIFDPYFTTKEREKGTGLGLSVVYGIVQELQGDIQVRSEVGKGTCITVSLPLLEKSPAGETAQTASQIQQGTERLLLVDDEPAIVQLERQQLERLGYHVTAVADSRQALAIFREDPYGVDLVLTDMTMPGMTGDRLARELLALRPDIPVIICTGFSEKIRQSDAADIGISDFLLKPVGRLDLAKAVRRALDGRRSAG